MKQINSFTYPVVKCSGGRWFIEYRLNGQRKRKYYTIDKRPQFYGEQLARKVAKELEAANELPGVKLYAAIDQSLQSMVLRKTSRNLYTLAAAMLKAEIKNQPLQQIDKSKIAGALYKRAAAKCWAANSTASYLRAIKALFGKMVELGLIDKNPATGIKAKAGEVQRHTLLTAGEIEKIKIYFLQHKPQMWGVCQLVYYCALRPAEVLKLLPKNLNSGFVHLSAASAKNKKALKRPLPPNFAGLPAFKSIASFYVYFNQMKKACDLRPAVTLYSFRHTAAVRLYEQTKDIKHVQAFLRHSSVSVTDTYLRNLGVIEETSGEGLPLI